MKNYLVVNSASVSIGKLDETSTPKALLDSNRIPLVGIKKLQVQKVDNTVGAKTILRLYDLEDRVIFEANDIPADVNLATEVYNTVSTKWASLAAIQTALETLIN